MMPIEGKSISPNRNAAEVSSPQRNPGKEYRALVAAEGHFRSRGGKKMSRSFRGFRLEIRFFCGHSFNDVVHAMSRQEARRLAATLKNAPCLACEAGLAEPVALGRSHTDSDLLS